MTEPAFRCADPGAPLVVRPARAMVMLDCGFTQLYELLNSGELKSYREGKSRKIIVKSIYDLIERRLREAQPNLRSPGRQAAGSAP
jgi:hypothetical protein